MHSLFATWLDGSSSNIRLAEGNGGMGKMFAGPDPDAPRVTRQRP
jgi:hypothetical protein